MVYTQTLGKIELDRLRSSNIHKWLVDLIDQDEEADDEVFASRTRPTGTWQHSKRLHNRLVASDAGWKTVKTFAKVGAAQGTHFISMEQRKALLAKCRDDLQLLVTAMLLTGARPGELATLNASDFNKQLGALTLRGKTGARTVAISTAATIFRRRR